MFTQEQINEIEQRLALKGSKDTQLPEAELPLKGDETVAIIQEGENRNLPIEIFIKYPIEGAFNVSKYLQLINKEETLVKVSLEDAVTSVPTMAKNEGQTIVFIDSNNTWQCYQYQGDTIDDWEDLLKWKNLNDSSPAPIEEGAQIYNISEYLPGGAKYGQLIGAGVYTIYGDVTPVSQYRTIFGWDPDLGEVLNPEEKDTSLVIKEIDTDGVSAYEYYVFVGNDSDGYGYQTTLTSTEEDIPEWIAKAFGSTNDTILVNINKLKEEIDRTKISKGGLKTIQGKSIEGVGNIEISTYINQFASSNNPINWNWGGDGNIGTIDIDNVKGVKASYSEEYETGNVYSVLDVTLKARQHYLFSFYLSGEGECDLSLSDLWDNVYVREFSNPIIIDGDEYIEFDNWKSHLKFTSIGYHYISFYADTNGAAQIDFEFNTNNNIIFYKPLFVACNPKSTVSWFANDEDIFTTKEQFGIAFKGVAYNSTTKKIEFTCVDNTKKYLDATDFVKDGMVSSVAIVNGNLVITFNTDSGKEDIIIPLTDVFNPANYYTKAETNANFPKYDEQGKVRIQTDNNNYTVISAGNISFKNPTWGNFSTNDLASTINSKASKATTLAGYGITDAKIENGVITLGSNSITPITSHQDISDKADKSEMSVVPGTGTNADKTTITLKQGTSATVLTAHQDISGKADSSSLASVATSGSYNDLFDKPTMQDLATVKHVYALDSTNPDYPSIGMTYYVLDTTSVFGAISIINITSGGVEDGLSDIEAYNYSRAETTIDNTTYTSYYYNNKYYLGIWSPFFVANVAQYGHDKTLGVLKFIATQNGLFKVHSIGVTPSNCTITVNGVTTTSLRQDLVAVQVNAGDVVKIIPTLTSQTFVRIIGFVLEGNCGVSVFVNDAGYLTEHQDISGKTDKVSNATNGNFAALDSNGNLVDSGHKHSDYLTQHQSLSNYVQKSQTTGLLKNDGSVDTNTYLTQHQDISGKANKNEMSVVSGTGADIDKTTITLKQGTSATVLTAHQDITGKEDITPIEAVASGTTALTAQVNKYYEVAGTVSSLTVTLPTPTVSTEVTMVVVHLTVGASPTVVVTSVNEVVKFSSAYSVVANKEYELSCLYNGSKWIVSSMEVAV